MQKVSNQQQGCIYHLFEVPLSKEQSLLRRIGNVIFHILTLGIPFIIYRVIACCSKKSRPLPPPLFIDFAAIRSGQAPLPEVSSIGKDIIEETISSIEDHKDIVWDQEIDVIEDTSLNQRLGQLYLLTQKYSYDILKKLKANKDLEDPYQDPEIHSLVDKYIRTSYVLGMQLLDNLPLMVSTPLAQSKQLSYERIFENNKIRDMLKTSFVAYRNTRSFMKYEEDRLGCVYAAIIPEDYAKPFYQENTKQNEWRQLYNELSDRLQCYLKEEHIDMLSSRFTVTMKPDHRMEDFRTYFIDKSFFN